MASLERRNEIYRVVFMYRGKKYGYSLKTKIRKDAESLVGGIEKTLMRIEQNLLAVPDDVDIITFVKNDGQFESPKDKPRRELITLGELIERYKRTHSLGSMEANSLYTALMHLRHFETTLGKNFPMQTLAHKHLQEHIERRAKIKVGKTRKLSPTTIKKEMASFRAAWNWAAHQGLITGPFPNRGLVYPKTDEKPPYQTWEEIERQIVRGMDKTEAKELWDCLFLTLPEIEELLEYVRQFARHGFIYPMFCFAAHTGARRSELLRLRWQDIDFDSETAVLHEKKRTRGKRTSRRAPLSPFLIQALHDWQEGHPGGQFVFCHALRVQRSKKKRNEHTPLTRDEAHDHFQRTLAGSKWEKLRGWHVLRHSFISNCAAAGVDQRMIDEWVGHQTEEMRKRYRHLIPNQQKQAIRSVFGGQ